MGNLANILLLLAVAISVVVTFQRLHIPTSLGYLLVGVLVGPYTIGPTVSVPELQPLAEFGVVFLLFTIGLSFSLPQLHALRHQVLGLGTGQVVFTTLLVAGMLWLAGLPGTVAFVFGAIAAQSSTTILASLLNEQGEENSQHGRIGLAMSVFQDVTAVPFLVIIPVLGVTVTAGVLGGSLVWAIAKAAFAFTLVFFVGRWLFRPLFHLVAESRSAEIFTLAVLLVALLSAWTTNSFGLSLAFGGFLAGMMLGETEFRHQVESSIRPFRDVLLGMFFVGIGMRFDLAALPPIWYWTVLGALIILVSKILIVTALVRRIGVDAQVAWRTGLILGVGGEFGLALVAIALDSNVIDMRLGQIAITSVLLAMIIGAALIRTNGAIAARLAKTPRGTHSVLPNVLDVPERHVVIGGYGRVGRTVAVLLRANGVPFLAFDRDPKQVARGIADGFPVFYGDIAEPGLLTAIRAERAALIVITVDKSATALATIAHLRTLCPQVPVIARARDIETTLHLLDAGVVEAHPETIEASLYLGATALRILHIPEEAIDSTLQEVRDQGYTPVLEEKPDD
jgi:monovalent cation:H+ antiporter-2, CPA2 family